MNRLIVGVIVALSTTAALFPIEPVERPAELGSRPKIVAFDVTQYTADGVKIVRSESDIHLVAEVPIDAFAQVFLNHDRTGAYLPNLVSYEWTPVPTTGKDVIIEVQRIGVQFMGIDATYQIRQRSEAVDRLSESPRAFFVEYQMTESLDGKLHASGGTFVLEEVVKDGRPATYVRQQNVTEFADPFFGFARILRAFAPGGSRRMFHAMVEEAKRYVD